MNKFTSHTLFDSEYQNEISIYRNLKQYLSWISKHALWVHFGSFGSFWVLISYTWAGLVSMHFERKHIDLAG